MKPGNTLALEWSRLPEWVSLAALMVFTATGAFFGLERLGILVGSLLSGVVGYGLLRISLSSEGDS